MKGPVVRRFSARPGHEYGGLIILCWALLLAGCEEIPTAPDGAGWDLELVATGRNVGLHSEVVCTSTGEVYVAYYDARFKGLHLAHRTTGGSWADTPLDAPGWVGRYLNAFITPDDTIHIAYQDLVPQRLRYARGRGDAWSYQYVDISNTRAVGVNPVLALAPGGPSLMDINEDGYISLWSWSGPGWAILGAKSDALNEGRGDMVWRAGGLSIAKIMILKIPNRSTRYGYQVVLLSSNDGHTPWTSSVIEDVRVGLSPSAYAPDDVALGKDASDHLHLLFRKEKGDLVDDVIGGAQSVVDTGTSNDIIKMVPDPSGGLTVLYRKGDALALSHCPAGGSWERLPLIRDLFPLGRWGLFVGLDGAIHVSVYNSQRQELWYAHGPPE
jgi:hypothetical protein